MSEHTINTTQENLHVNGKCAPWTPYSWKSKPIKQHVEYEDQAAFEKAKAKLIQLPPLVTVDEVKKLKVHLRNVALGKAFLLQGGDCAELFDYCTKDPIENKLKVLIQMSLTLIYGARLPVVRVARMAGQYAKPRSSPTEKVDGVEYPSFRGDNINGFSVDERKPDPERLVDAYFHSSATLNYVRSLLASGFANLTRFDKWDLSHVKCSSARKEFQDIVDQILNTMDFMEVIGAVNREHELPPAFNTIDMFMSHEGLVLDYEAALTRPHVEKHSGETRYYNLSTHYVWVGDRTRQPDGAHIEYLSGIENPIGIKVGPTTDPDTLIELLDKLNPHKEIGKITLITRFGADKVHNHLSKFIKAVQKTDHIVVWVCDPMHGNTETSTCGVKTRHFNNIMSEVASCIRIHAENQSKLNGVHFELTGETVTECLGGGMELDHHNLNENYQTYCDPRLNYEQSLDMAFLIARCFEKERSGLKKCCP
ncbi:phospho-2-dehydro-3-deoxyheptonate aldolase-like protein [Neoconidiobolus thromboides FSU 785]|nr:phospho-2-dehydro-3-deoxyheptonate aldolase-like protein [Neoconidiobolus thromboides FSU 785]